MARTATTARKASEMLTQSRGSQQPAPAPAAVPDATESGKRSVAASDYEDDDIIPVPKKKILIDKEPEPVVEEDEESEPERDAEGSAEDDDDAASVDTVTRFENHRRDSVSHQDTAKKAFFKQSNVYKWKGKRGDYIIWAYKKTGNMSEAGHKWPHAFVHEEAQTVNAAMWAVGKKGQLTLATIWTFSPGGDETNEYSLPFYHDEACALHQDYKGPNSPITDKASAEHFSVSSGDYKVDGFHCPALENITASEMQELEKKHGRK